MAKILDRRKQTLYCSTNYKFNAWCVWQSLPAS